MQITTATPSQFSGIVELWKEFMDYHKEIDPLFTRSEKGHISFIDHVEELLEKDTAHVLVALDREKVVGYAIAEITIRPPVFQERTYGVISDIAVTSSYRRQGIGSKMVGKIREWFHSRDVTRIELRAVSENDVSCAFWGKQGFREYMRVMYINTEDE